MPLAKEEPFFTAKQWFNDKNESFLTVNETLLYQANNYIINAFKKSME
jgi:hypothetical protein